VVVKGLPPMHGRQQSEGQYKRESSQCVSIGSHLHPDARGHDFLTWNKTTLVTDEVFHGLYGASSPTNPRRHPFGAVLILQWNFLLKLEDSSLPEFSEAVPLPELEIRK